MGYQEIGEQRPEGWQPKLNVQAMIKLGVDNDGYPEFILSGDFPMAMMADKQENGEELLPPAALSSSKSKLDLLVVADCWFEIHLDKRAFQGWLTDDPAIMTKDKHHDKYFELAYFDAQSGKWISRAEAQATQLVTHAIRFGAQLLPAGPAEAHKVSFNFMFSKQPTYHDPDIRNPVIP